MDFTHSAKMRNTISTIIISGISSASTKISMIKTVTDQSIDQIGPQIGVATATLYTLVVSNYTMYQSTQATQMTMEVEPSALNQIGRHKTPART